MCSLGWCLGWCLDWTGRVAMHKGQDSRLVLGLLPLGLACGLEQHEPVPAAAWAGARAGAGAGIECLLNIHMCAGV